MPADLTVKSIRLQPPLLAPCPQFVYVMVMNIGSDRADSVPFDVTVELFAGEEAVGCFKETVHPVEGVGVADAFEVEVEVTFPCTSPVRLRATVDGRRQVPNNVPTAPSIELPGLSPIPTVWFAGTLRVGIVDSTGTVTFDPDAFCPGRPLVSQVTIENKGCLTAKPNTSEILLWRNSVPFASHTFLVPALAPGASHLVFHSFTTPPSVTGPNDSLMVWVKPDINGANPDQCQYTQVVAAVAKPFSVGQSPRATLTAPVFINPGEVPSLSWQIDNDCSDIGSADVRILFGTPATELYRTTLAMPLRATTGEDLAPPQISIPTNIANAFWTFGTKTLTLEITGNGADPGPYTATDTLTVVPEVIDATWWTWGTGPPPGGAPGVFSGSWKSSYTVTGTFTNRGRVSMTVSALSALEHPTDVIGTSQDQTIAPLGGIVGAPVGVLGSLTAAWSRFQAWPWLAQGTFIETGPRSRTFTYVATITLTDAFGNTYPPTAPSPAATAVVSVSAIKVNHLDNGRIFVSAGLALLAAAAAAVVIFGYPYGAIAAVILAAAGMAMIIGGTLRLYDAYDPPIPDFRDSEPPAADPSAWTIPEADDGRLHPLHTLSILVTRAVSARVRAVRYRDRTWAAYVDRDEPGRARHRDEARHQLETLRRLARPTSDAADEAHESFDQLLNRMDAIPTADDLRDVARRTADELHLNDVERTIVDERLSAIDDQDVERSVELARSEGIQTVGELVRTTYETTAAEFAQREYLD